jgi:hypothetical protein
MERRLLAVLGLLWIEGCFLGGQGYFRLTFVEMGS